MRRIALLGLLPLLLVSAALADPVTLPSVKSSTGVSVQSQAVVLVDPDTGEALAPETLPTVDLGQATSANSLPVTLSSDQSTLPVQEASNTGTHISTATTTQVKSGAGTLVRVVVNSKGTVASAVAIYDATSGTTNPVAIIDSLNLSGTFEYDVAVSTGIRVVTTGTVAPDVTVVWR